MDQKELEISEEIPIELLQTGIEISDKEVSEHSHLILEEIEGNLLDGKKITINAKGMVNGLRSEQDGICFLGTGEKKDGKYINDFVLNIDNTYSPNLKNSHVLVIYYRRDLQNFYLNNFEENKEKYFIFVLMEEYHQINENEDFLFSVLDYNFKVTVNKNNKNLTIEYGQGNNLEKVVFTKDKPRRSLGRRTDCDLVINDPQLSREQTTFTFDSTKNCWFIKDGGSEILSRTGTWLFLDKPYCIKHNVTFKMGPSLLKIEIKK